MAERTNLTLYRNSDVKVTYSLPDGYNLSGFAPVFYFRASEGESPLLTVSEAATGNGSVAVVAGDAVVLTVKAADVAAFPAGDIFNGVYDSTLTKDGFVNRFVGGPLVAYVDGSYGEGTFSDSIFIDLNGKDVGVIIEGGNLGIAAAVDIAALNTAVNEAEAAAISAANSADEAAATVAGKLNVDGDNAAAGLLQAVGAQFPDLTAQSLPVQDGDILAGYRSPGPLKRFTASNLSDYIKAFFSASGGSDLVGFIQDGTGAVAETLQETLRQGLSVRPEQFGALTTPTIATATLLRAFTFAMANSIPVLLSGSYTINGPITPSGAVNGAELRIDLSRGDATITVDSGATAFNRVFFAESATVTNHSISGGGTLTIDCNDKAAVGIWLRHTAAQTGGSIRFDTPVRVLNAHGGAADDVAAGIYILGRYEEVFMESPYVLEVTRDKAAAESAGISVSGFDGSVVINNPYTGNIRVGAGTTDADGIKTFGRQSGTSFNKREGSVRISNPVFENCQGRSFKDQCGDTIVTGAVFRRDASVLVAISQCVEADFQYGNGLLVNALAEYSKDGATSPLGGSHSFVTFQQVLDNAEMSAAAINSTIISDVELPIFANHVTASVASRCSTLVQGVTMIPRAGFTATMIGRAILQFDASQVVAKSTETVLAVIETSVPNTFPVIGYTSYSTGDLTSKLSWTVDKCATSLDVAGQGTRAFHNLSGNPILAVKSFMLGPNPGYRNYYQNWTVCIKKMRAGSEVVLALGGSTAFVDTDFTTPVSVPWGTSGTLVLSCSGISNYASASSDTICQAFLNNATVSPSVWFTQDGGLNFGALN